MYPQSGICVAEQLVSVLFREPVNENYWHSPPLTLCWIFKSFWLEHIFFHFYSFVFLFCSNVFSLLFLSLSHSLMFGFGWKWMHANSLYSCVIRLLLMESKWNRITFEAAATTIFTFVRSIWAGMPKFAGAMKFNGVDCVWNECARFHLAHILRTKIRRRIRWWWKRMNGKTKRTSYTAAAQCAHSHIQSVHVVRPISLARSLDPF